MSFKFFIVRRISLALGIVSLIPSLLIVFHNPISYNYSQNIKKNWNARSITDILEKNSESCPENYHELIFDIWKGTYDGCDCVNSEASKRINKGKCSFEMVNSGCSIIHPLPEVKMNTWRGKGLCVKYSRFTYLEILSNEVIIKENLQCDEKSRKDCGVIDTFGNKLCLRKEEECPVNKILIQKENGDPPQDHHYMQIHLANGFNLFFTTEAIEHSIIVELALSEESICLDTQRKFTSKDQYPLLKDYEDYGCNSSIGDLTEDPRFYKIDTNTKRNVYNDNKIAISKLAYYDQSSLDVEMNLYDRPYIGFKIEYIQNGAITIDEMTNALHWPERGFAWEFCQIYGVFVHLCAIFINICLGKENATENEEREHEIIQKVLLINPGVCIFIRFYLISSQEVEMWKYCVGDQITNLIIENEIKIHIAPMKWIQLIIGIIIIANVLIFPFVNMFEKICSSRKAVIEPEITQPAELYDITESKSL